RNDSGIAQDELLCSYYYGFPAEIGAGPYDRRTLGPPPARPPQPEETVSLGAGLPAALGTLDNPGNGTGTVTIADSLTYDAVADVGTANPIVEATIRSGNRQRPLIRLDGGEWSVTGQDGTLVFDGLF